MRRQARLWQPTACCRGQSYTPPPQTCNIVHPIGCLVRKQRGARQQGFSLRAAAQGRARHAWQPRAPQIGPRTSQGKTFWSCRQLWQISRYHHQSSSTAGPVSRTTSILARRARARRCATTCDCVEKEPQRTSLLPAAHCANLTASNRSQRRMRGAAASNCACRKQNPFLFNTSRAGPQARLPLLSANGTRQLPGVLQKERCAMRVLRRRSQDCSFPPRFSPAQRILGSPPDLREMRRHARAVFPCPTLPEYLRCCLTRRGYDCNEMTLFEGFRRSHGDIRRRCVNSAEGAVS